MSDASKKVLLSVPEPMLKRLDSEAKKNQRSRSAEMRVRLWASLKAAPARKAREAA